MRSRLMRRRKAPKRRCKRTPRRRICIQTATVPVRGPVATTERSSVLFWWRRLIINFPGVSSGNPIVQIVINPATRNILMSDDVLAALCCKLLRALSCNRFLSSKFLNFILKRRNAVSPIGAPVEQSHSSFVLEGSSTTAPLVGPDQFAAWSFIKVVFRT